MWINIYLYFFEINSPKNRPRLSFIVFPARAEGAAALTPELPRGLIYSKMCNCKIIDKLGCSQKKVR